MAIDPRKGAGKKLQPAQIHGGCYHFRSGVLVRDLSRTQSAPLLDGGLPVETLTTGQIEKRFYDQGQAPVHPSLTPRRPHTSTVRDAGEILRDASNMGRKV
jgi:hypothetical protein